MQFSIARKSIATIIIAIAIQYDHIDFSERDDPFSPRKPLPSQLLQLIDQSDA